MSHPHIEVTGRSRESEHSGVLLRKVAARATPSQTHDRGVRVTRRRDGLVSPDVVSTGGNIPRNYDIAADSQRFLMLKARGSDATDVLPQIVVVEHFDEELKRLVPWRSFPEVLIQLLIRLDEEEPRWGTFSQPGRRYPGVIASSPLIGNRQ